MIVHLRLDRCEGPSRSFTVQRRNTWLPPARYREVLQANDSYLVWRDYILDRHASADRGVIVYRQIDPRPMQDASL